jgi:hypothetical protein
MLNRIMRYWFRNILILGKLEERRRIVKIIGIYADFARTPKEAGLLLDILKAINNDPTT